MAVEPLALVVESISKENTLLYLINNTKGEGMSEKKISITIEHESGEKQKKFKNLDFSVKVVLERIPKSLKELEDVMERKDARAVLEMSLKDIITHNENISEYARMYRGDPVSETNKRNIVENVCWNITVAGVKFGGPVPLPKGSYRNRVNVSNLLGVIFAGISDKISEESSINS
jgi:hypothetical protein